MSIAAKEATMIRMVIRERLSRTTGMGAEKVAPADEEERVAGEERHDDGAGLHEYDDEEENVRPCRYCSTTGRRY
jgi:hypothetical protein